MKRFLPIFIFVAVAFAVIPLTAIANPAAKKKATATKSDPSYGKFNSLDAWVVEIERLYPDLKLIVKKETSRAYFAVFSASPTNDRVAICSYSKKQNQKGSVCSWSFLEKDGKSIPSKCESNDGLTKEYRHETHLGNGILGVSYGDVYSVSYGWYWDFKNYTGPARIEFGADSKVIARFEITKPKHP